MEFSSKLQEAYKNEKDYWQQKSRKMWHSVGMQTQNSALFSLKRGGLGIELFGYIMKDDNG